MKLIIIFAVVIFVIVFNLFVYFLWRKVMKLEKIIIGLHKSKNSQIVWIYQVAKDDLVKWNEIFKEFFELKRRDFWEEGFYTRLRDKSLIYKKIHNEVNFIFKICEKHENIQINPIYIYLKNLIHKKDKEIWEKMSLYEDIAKKYDNYKAISYFTIVGYFY
jgi:hypothetical protein